MYWTASGAKHTRINIKSTRQGNRPVETGSTGLLVRTANPAVGASSRGQESGNEATAVDVAVGLHLLAGLAGWLTQWLFGFQ